MTYPVTDAERAVIAARHAPTPPDGHAPMSSMTMPAGMICEPMFSPRWLEAQANYDAMYFAAHPEEREKYGYKGP